MSDSKNDIAWSSIFSKYSILEKISKEGHVIINSTEINEYREARLMTKFDHKSQLPELFAKNNLSILPVSRGGYIISQIDTFHDFKEDDIDIIKIDFPGFLESLDYNDITSEATAINCAFVSRILQHFTEEEELYPTVSGRMGSSVFNFNINSKKGVFKVNVNNSQVEIDGGYEGNNSLNLIEAKNYISADFLVRQLYYPYKLWSNKITKKVRPIFLTYTNGIFHLREYEFEVPDHYNSLKLIRQCKYAVQEGSINLETIETILHKTKVVPEPHIPFPQADSFERVVNLCELLKQRGTISKEDITTNYDFDSRQTDYYTNAGKYLGLIEQRTENKQIVYSLSNEGQRVFCLSIIKRQLEFVSSILSHEVFNKTLKFYLKKGDVPNKQEVVEIMKKSKLHNVVSETTYIRRSQTILCWIDWILNLTQE